MQATSQAGQGFEGESGMKKVWKGLNRPVNVGDFACIVAGVCFGVLTYRIFGW